MSLYGGIDLHANNRVIVLRNEKDEVIYWKRFPNALPTMGCEAPIPSEHYLYTTTLLSRES